MLILCRSVGSEFEVEASTAISLLTTLLSQLESVDRVRFSETSSLHPVLLCKEFDVFLFLFV